MDESLFSSVCALIDAKIAARAERLRLRRERVSGRASAPRAPSLKFCECDAGIASCRFPDDLHVPSSDPHPPNLHAANLSFAARVIIAVRDKFGGDAPRVYKAAGLTAAAYSQIVSDETHKVTKHTAVRFAFALRLTPTEARLLLKAAGHAFSSAQTEDFILEACLEHNPPIYDFDDVNALLKKHRVKYQY